MAAEGVGGAGVDRAATDQHAAGAGHRVEVVRAAGEVQRSARGDVETAAAGAAAAEQQRAGVYIDGTRVAEADTDAGGAGAGFGIGVGVDETRVGTAIVVADADVAGVLVEEGAGVGQGGARAGVEVAAGPGGGDSEVDGALLYIAGVVAAECEVAVEGGRADAVHAAAAPVARAADAQRPGAADGAAGHVECTHGRGVRKRQRTAGQREPSGSIERQDVKIAGPQLGVEAAQQCIIGCHGRRRAPVFSDIPEPVVRSDPIHRVRKRRYGAKNQ